MMTEEMSVGDCLLHASDVTLRRGFTPKPQPIVPLTVTQITVPMLPAIMVFTLTSVIFFLLPHDGDMQLRIALGCTFGLSFNAIVLIIFAEYIFVSKWITHIMFEESGYVRNVSFNTLKRIMNKRLALMCGVGIICSVLSVVGLVWVVILVSKVWWLLGIVGPVITWATVELIISEFC